MVLDKEKIYNVLDQGFIRVVDLMGTDDSIVQSARISYGKGTKSLQDDRNLIRYLMRHRHTSPFEMCEIKVHVKAPIFVVRQWVRHRTANFNEYSARYSEMNDHFYYPGMDMLQKQSSINKQGGTGSFDPEEYEEVISSMKQVCDSAYSTYQKLLSMNVARETARCVLPVNIYTEFYWKIDAHNFMHFLRLRCEENSQQEIRAYALILRDIFKEWMPITHEAFMDYSVKSRTYSVIEAELLEQCIDKDRLTSLVESEERLSKREKQKIITS
jgi:thymidylate synthase (FAD)